MRAVWMPMILMRVSVRSDVMRNVFVYWSNMFARLVSRAIAGGRARGVVRS
jgi:hypothetical protein